MQERGIIAGLVVVGLLVAPVASGQIRVDGGSGGGDLATLEVENLVARANANDATVHVQSGVCTRLALIVETEYDASGDKAYFEGDSDHGGSFSDYRFVAGNWEGTITTNTVCPGTTIFYDIYVEAWDGQVVSDDADQGKVIYVIGV